jgi:hypothetical protein
MSEFSNDFIVPRAWDFCFHRDALVIGVFPFVPREDSRACVKEDRVDIFCEVGFWTVVSRSWLPIP